ncbi:MAG: hypothetical protein WCE81_01780 [Halobacteriota archaeon]
MLKDVVGSEGDIRRGYSTLPAKAWYTLFDNGWCTSLLVCCHGITAPVYRRGS